MALTRDVGAAYTAAGHAWQAGPTRVYDRLAEVLVARSPVAVRGAVVADIGAGTGAGGRAVRRAGAAAVAAFDVAPGMLLADPDRPPAAAADARALPVRPGAFDLALAAFSLNHLEDPARGLAEAARVVSSGGGLVVGAYASDDGHPVKEAVERVLDRYGWRPPAWVAWMRSAAIPRLSTVEGASAAALEGGLRAVEVEHHRVAFPELDVDQLVSWRLGMAQHAPFLEGLPPQVRARITREVLDAVGPDPDPLVRSLIVLTAVV